MENVLISEWLKLLTPLIGGGAVGAIITLFVTNYRNKIQIVETKIQIEKIFFPETLTDSEITKITFSSATQTYNFDNLFIASLLLTNSGNKDIDKFILGITLPNEVKALKVNFSLQDRNHQVNLKNNISFDKMSNEIDLELLPFNRLDKYEIKLYLTIAKETIELKDIKLSTPHPVTFVPSKDSAFYWNSAKKIMEYSIPHY